jgi:hypothetical protein
VFLYSSHIAASPVAQYVAAPAVLRFRTGRRWQEQRRSPTLPVTNRQNRIAISAAAPWSPQRRSAFQNGTVFSASMARRSWPLPRSRWPVAIASKHSIAPSMVLKARTLG